MVHSFVRFLNCTVRRVDVVWLNYEGVGIRYRTLAPNQWVDVNTFVGHPWIFRDSITGDKLVVQLKEIFEPPSWKDVDENALPQRKTFNITIPGEFTVGLVEIILHELLEQPNCGHTISQMDNLLCHIGNKINHLNDQPCTVMYNPF